jgi:hypothetical protein
MKNISRRLRKLEDRFGPPVETASARRLRERIEAGRRRVEQWRKQQGISVSDQDREKLSGLSVAEILNRGRAKAREHRRAEGGTDIMKAVIRRIARLEDQFAPKVQPDFLRHPRHHMRLLVSGLERDLTLETSTCHRTLTGSGCLIEVVTLDGRRGGVTDEDLQKFVKSFPVEAI